MNAKRNYRIIGLGTAALLFAAAGSPAVWGEPQQAGRYSERPADASTTPRALPPAPVAAAATPLPAAGVHAKQQCVSLLQSARAALARGDLAGAERFATRATSLRLPEASFAVNEDSPARLAWDLQMARYRRDAGVIPALGHSGGRTDQALHVDAHDTTSNTPVAYEGAPGQPRLAQAQSGGSGAAPRPTGSAAGLIEQGEQQLRNGDFNKALNLFQQADRGRDQLTPAQRGRLNSHLKMLAGTEPGSIPAPAAPSAPAASSGTRQPLTAPNTLPPPLQPIASNDRSLLDDTESAQQRLDRQLRADVGAKQLEAKRLRQSDPRGALKMLQDLRANVEASRVSQTVQGVLIRRVDAAIAETDRYIEANRAEIELDEANAAVLAEVERRRATSIKLQNRKAQLVDEFNKLRDEQRYAEAELVAKRLHEMMGPHDELAAQILLNAKFLRREMLNRETLAGKEDNIWNSFQDVEAAASTPTGDGREFLYGNSWNQIRDRESLSQETRLTPREVEIRRRLSTPVQVKFRNRSLSEVMNSLASLTGINIHLDPRGLTQEGVATDTPVEIELTDQVMLKSALNLILGPLHLSYVIKDEVLMITSEQLRDGETTHKVYYVADLVTPIPNFVPGSNFGMQGLINDAHRSVGFGGGGLTAPRPITVVPDRPRVSANGSPLPGNVLGQNIGGGTGFGAGGGGGGSPLLGGGGAPSGGGGADADFDSLIDLIVSTVASETWAESGGGEAEIRPYFNNLSLVISQTQAVHEQIADLLEQLRRLQDLQITIEVRFITLSDTFFEQIGVDFNFNINDEATDLVIDPVTGFETPARGAVVGAAGPPIGGLPGLTTDFDIPFRQGSFLAAVPPAFTPAAGAASFGFAILSDIEAFFLVTAAQGDQRTNQLDAPKVTLFNGQTAFIANTSQTPFVISVIPVVGEFAAAQQPVIVVLSEGTLMNIQAVVSEDRRYVRMTVVPFFSQIEDVDTFTFEGSTSTSTSSSTTDDDDDGTSEAAADADDTVVSGVTVQLPTFAFITVATTVSVPDGGTVLLGGIKTLDEGRNEFGVPLLSKLPYINRLFRNVGIGRDTSSLMFMVTPRIIIQEEEEEKLGIAGT